MVTLKFKQEGNTCDDHVDVSHAPVQYGIHARDWIKVKNTYGHHSEDIHVSDLKSWPNIPYS